MIYGILAIVSVFQFLGRSKRYGCELTVTDDDYVFPHAEIEFRRNEVDALEKELIEIETDLRITDELSELREVTLTAQKARLKAHLSRHKDRLNEMGY
jgi:hypothetical protein